MDWEKLMAGMPDNSLAHIIAIAQAEQAQRIEDKRLSIENELNLKAMEVASLAQHDRDDYMVTLRVELMKGRTYRIPLDSRAVKTWGIEVEVIPKTGE